MRPLTVITGILLGSSFSIAFSLAGVMCIFFILGDDHPRLNNEIRPLFNSFAIFTAMTAVTATSFYTLIKDLAGRWPAQGVMWLSLFSIVFYYWP